MYMVVVLVCAISLYGEGGLVFCRCRFLAQALCGEMQDLRRKWRLLSEEQQLEFANQASARWLDNQGASDEEEASAAASSTIAKQRVEQTFFGLGSRAWPYTPDNYEASVRQILSLGAGDRLPGHRKHCSLLRDVWLKDVLITGQYDDGHDIIPGKLNVKARLPCWLQHPGMCAHTDAWHMAESLPLAKVLANHFAEKPDIELGDFLQLELDCRDGRQRCISLCRGHVRVAHPRVALFARCRSSADSKHQLINHLRPPLPCFSTPFSTQAVPSDLPKWQRQA